MKEFKYLGTTLTNQNSIQEKIISRLKSGNACYHSVQNLLPFVLYGCETWSLTLREECGLRVFENGVLRKIFRSKKDEVTRSGNNYIMRSSVTCIPHPTLFG